MKIKLLTLAALCPLTAAAGLVTSSTAANSVTGDDLATALRDEGAAVWDADDHVDYELKNDGDLLFNRGGVDWYMSIQPLTFDASSLALWGIFSEASDENVLFAQGSSDASHTRIVGNQDGNFLTDSFVFTPTDASSLTIGLTLYDESIPTGPFDFLPNVVFATGTYDGNHYGLFMFDDRYNSLDNHDDFIGLVRYASVPEPSGILAAITAGMLSLLILRPRSRRNAA